MVSTMAAGDTRDYIGSSDIALMASVTDVAGVNAPVGGCTPACTSVSLNGFKDHGFGFSLGSLSFSTR